MIEIDIPDYGRLELANLVLDYNGTLACDGILLPGVAERLRQLADKLTVHVVTADTFGRTKEQLTDFKGEIAILPKDDQAHAKLEYIRRLTPEQCVCIGNGRNDRLMLEAAALGIAVLQEEGAASETIAKADALCRDIRSALDLLENPKRLVATLRS